LLTPLPHEKDYKMHKFNLFLKTSFLKYFQNHVDLNKFFIVFGFHLIIFMKIPPRKEGNVPKLLGHEVLFYEMFPNSLMDSNVNLNWKQRNSKESGTLLGS
jgi:hypothetical protein